MAFRNNCEQPKSRHFITIQVVGNCHKWKLGKLQGLSCRRFKHPRCPENCALLPVGCWTPAFPWAEQHFQAFYLQTFCLNPRSIRSETKPLTVGWFPPSDTTGALTPLPHSSAAPQGTAVRLPWGFLHGLLQFHSSITDFAACLVFLD